MLSLQWLKRLGLVVVVSLLGACGGSDPAPDIVDTARSDARFSVLAEAIDAADLSGTLSGSGPFTVFAPTNDAFAALLVELKLTKAQLLADKSLLRAVLQYHVLGSQVTSAAVPLGQAVSPLAGGIFKVDSQGGGLVVTDGRNRQAGVGFVDLRVKNGVIHALDKVLLPANRNIVQTAQTLPQFSILVEAVLAANLQGALSGTGPLTVFAPTNDAFAALLVELGVSKADLLANTALLTQVLTYHVVPGRVLKAGVPLNTAITTLQGESFTVDGSLAITDQRNRRAGITATDVLTSNGVVHVIDRVILPRP